jgi:AbiV family abortive infection protein
MRDLDSFFSIINKGEPTIDEYGRGMHLCFKNAESLLMEAEYLRGVRSPRALSLGVLALEEIGKIFVLCDAAGRGTIKTDLWTSLRRKAFSSHRHKQGLVAAYGSALLSKLHKDGCSYYETVIPPGAIPLLDRLKQWGFYVDFLAGTFQSPKTFVDENEEWIDWVISATKERLESIRPMHETEEMSVWLGRSVNAMVCMLKDSPSAEYLEARLREFIKTLQKPSEPLKPTPS